MVVLQERPYAEDRADVLRSIARDPRSMTQGARQHLAFDSVEQADDPTGSLSSRHRLIARTGTSASCGTLRTCPFPRFFARTGSIGSRAAMKLSLTPTASDH